ncbi:MAG: hypothetical protein AAFS07_17810 [Pseudomonadota bacterium]
MILFDILFAIAALVGLGAFLWVIISFVPEPALIVVVGIGVFMASFDFLRDLTRQRRASRQPRNPARDEAD